MVIRVAHNSGDRFTVSVRGHRIVVDQPSADGGGGDGPTPVELFVASLGSCVAFYANRALQGHGMGDGQVSVTVTYTMSPTPPARVSAMAIRVGLPSDTSAARLAAVRRAVTHCTVHNSIVVAPMIDMTVVAAADDAAGRTAGRHPALVSG